jgi:hypothetical protein
MSTVKNVVAQAALAAAFVCGASLSSFAQNPNAQVVVPDRGGSTVAGCYRVEGPLYGPYRMTFCLGRGDSYHVTGAGLDCRAGLDWHRTGPGRVEIELHYARCGKGAGWSADSLSCRAEGAGSHAEVVVPDRPGAADQLRCRYIPSERGYKPVSLAARRVR